MLNRPVILCALALLTCLTGCKTGSHPYSASATPVPYGAPTPSVGAGSFADIVDQLEGASIIAQDGTFLGVITRDKYAAKSIINEYGDFGSKYAANSMLNPYGVYGGKYSSNSPFNEYTSTPPVVVLRGQEVAYLTSNRSISPRVDPLVLIAYLQRG